MILKHFLCGAWICAALFIAISKPLDFGMMVWGGATLIGWAVLELKGK